MLDKTQCDLLLKRDMIVKIESIFSNYQLSNVRVFSPQYSDQNGKINFLVSQREDADPLDVNNATKEIKKILEYKDVNIFTDNILDPEIKPIIEREIMDFSYENVETYHRKKLGFEVEYQETSRSNVIIITLDKNVIYDKNHLLQTCAQAIQKEIEQNKLSHNNKNQVFFGTI